MTLQRLRPFLLALAASSLCLCAAAQNFELAGQWRSAKWTPGSWNGMHRLPQVYCLTFPAAGTVMGTGHGFYNKGGIYLTQVLYPDRVVASIVASTIPAGRSASEEISRLLATETQAEAAYGVSYNITQGETAFGATVSLRIKDVAPESRGGPFPLVRALIRPAKAPIETLSVHRLFARGSNRFEVATFQMAPEGANAGTEAAMTERLAGLADGIVRSLQECTASMPAVVRQ
ncbi:MAG: hypothetical protein JWP41_4306 [Ramlibacter sp.]|nr:hypothetical protein [Ramlibacter sp.]